MSDEITAESVPFDQWFPTAACARAGPLYLHDGRPCFRPHRIAGRAPVILNTIPKSGTYLYARLLELLGVVNTNVHLSASEFWDFRGAELRDIIMEPDDFKCELGIESTVGLLEEGQFAVAHIDRSTRTEASLKGLVHLFCVRDIRDVLVSHMRFLLDHRRRTRPNGSWCRASYRTQLFSGYLRGPGRRYLENRILPIAEWVESPGPAATLRFETIMGDAGEDAQRRCLETICELTHASATGDPLAILEGEVIGAETRTYSGARSSFMDYLNDETQALLESLGVDALNERLGY